MKVDCFTVGNFAMNCYLISDLVTSEAIIIDPGAESNVLIQTIEDNDLKLKYIINTHCHIDHVGEVKSIQDYFKVPFYIHEAETVLLNALTQQAQMFGLQVPGIPTVTSFLDEGHKIQFGSINGKVLHTPGHSPGSISLLFDGHVFVGDVLFYDSIGRTDLIQGDYDQLIRSIHNKLLTLSDNTIVYSGHGPQTTIGRERQLNPFLR